MLNPNKSKCDDILWDMLIDINNSVLLNKYLLKKKLFHIYINF